LTSQVVRLFADDAAVRRIGEGLLARSLAKEDWTHEAHLAACVWLLLEREDIVPERDLPAIIRRHNDHVGTINDATQGYHETLTQLYVGAVRHFLQLHRQATLFETVNALLVSELGARDWPLRFYSRERLFSADARAQWVEPDLAEILL
jgi:hypothetical protein